MIGIYICLTFLVNWSTQAELKKISAVFNLFQINFLFAIIFSSFLLSLAGFPPFSGFFYKFYLLNLLVNSNLFGLSFFLFIFYTISIFYYLRVIKLMFLNKNKS